jgi:hypothetical protein
MVKRFLVRANQKVSFGWAATLLAGSSLLWKIMMGFSARLEMPAMKTAKTYLSSPTTGESRWIVWPSI